MDCSSLMVYCCTSPIVLGPINGLFLSIFDTTDTICTTPAATKNIKELAVRRIGSQH